LCPICDSAMSAPPPAKRPRGEGATLGDDGPAADSNGLRALLRSARGTSTLLAKHSAAAQSLVTDEEDAIDALVTCCAVLLREHDVGLGVALNAIKRLAALAEGEQASWRDLARLREHPLSPALAGCDEHLTQQLHTIAEVLQFPTPVSLLLQRQLAVFRIRREAEAAAGGSDTATLRLVRAEAVLAPLLEQAEGFVHTFLTSGVWSPSGMSLGKTPAFWRGLFGDSEDLESLDRGSRGSDHGAYGAGWLLGGRGLLPDLLQAPVPRCAGRGSGLDIAAAVVGDVAALAALYHAGRNIGAVCVSAAAKAGQVEVIRLALALGWDFSLELCLRVAATADLSSDTRLQVLSLLTDRDMFQRQYLIVQTVGLLEFSRCGDVQCARRLARLGSFIQWQLDGAVQVAAAGGHIPVMTMLLEHGASLTPDAFQASANVEVLQWCADRGCSVDAAFFKAAAAGGRLFQLEWAASHTDISELLDEELIACAAGGIPTMEWLRARGCPWDSRVLHQACKGARPKRLAFALRHGCPLDDFEQSTW